MRMIKSGFGVCVLFVLCAGMRLLLMLMRKTNIFDYLDISGGRKAAEIQREREGRGGKRAQYM